MQTIKTSSLSNRMLACSCELASILLITALLVSTGATASDHFQLDSLIEINDRVTGAGPPQWPTSSGPHSSDLSEVGLPNAEVEASLDVENILNQASEQTEGQDYDRFLEVSAEWLQNTLVAHLQSAEAGESSSSGEVRGYSSQLMHELVLLYEQANLCKLDELSAGSEAIGRRSIKLEKQLEMQLVQLNRYLAALFCVSEHCTEAEPHRKEEKSWFEKALELIGLWVHPSRFVNQTVFIANRRRSA